MDSTIEFMSKPMTTPWPGAGPAAEPETPIRVGYVAGDVTRLAGIHSTGWRQLPFHVVAQFPAGQARIRWNRNRIMKLEAGDGVLIPAGVMHWNTKTSPEDVIARWVHLTVRVRDTEDPLAEYREPVRLEGEAASQLGLQIELLTTEVPDLGLAAVARWQAIKLDLFSSLLSALPPPEREIKPPAHQPRIAAVVAQMRQRLQNPPTVEELAEFAHMSLPHFHAVFRQLTGLPPGRYLQELRLQEARRLLLETHLTVRHIATSVGYGDAFHFSRLFKARTGTSPRRYRGQMRGQFFK